jgi:UDP-GlcNAc:undecaprenyl-phosphate GlcNAc-1-phosphate transferase
VSLSVLLMYIGTTLQWPGDYLLGVLYGVVGIAACLVVTFLPSRRRAASAAAEDAEPEPQPDPAPAQEDAR